MYIRPVQRSGFVAVALASDPVAAEKSGGTLRVYNSTNPPSASILEEATIATVMPFMAVFNNLVLFDQSKPRNSIDGIIPDLAETWKWEVQAAPSSPSSFARESGGTTASRSRPGTCNAPGIV